MNAIDANIEITANRVVLRPVSMKYKEDIFREFTPGVTKYMPFTPNGDITVTEDFIRTCGQELQKGTSLQLCILLQNTHEEFLGCCGLHHLDTKAIEIGLWLKTSAQGRGYGLEAVEALIRWVTEKYEFDQLLYPVDKENLASRSIPEKFGFIAGKSYLKRKSDTENLDVIEYIKDKKDI